MKIIKELEELIEEEVHDVKKYAKLAAEYKHDHPALSHVFYTLSTEEEKHQAMLHEEVVKIIHEYRKSHGDPPVAMQAVYDHLHKRHVEKLAEAKNFQELYRNM